MDLIILLIKLIARGFDSSGDKSPRTPDEAARQMDIARQIQQRIQEARQRAAQQDPSGPMMARLPPPVQRVAQRTVQHRQTGRQPTALRADGAHRIAAAPKRKTKRLAPPPLPMPPKPVAASPAPLFPAEAPAPAVEAVDAGFSAPGAAPDPEREAQTVPDETDDSSPLE